MGLSQARRDARGRRGGRRGLRLHEGTFTWKEAYESSGRSGWPPDGMACGRRRSLSCARSPARRQPGQHHQDLRRHLQARPFQGPVVLLERQAADDGLPGQPARADPRVLHVPAGSARLSRGPSGPISGAGWKSAPSMATSNSAGQVRAGDRRRRAERHRRAGPGRDE